MNHNILVKCPDKKFISSFLYNSLLRPIIHPTSPPVVSVTCACASGRCRMDETPRRARYQPPLSTCGGREGEGRVPGVGCAHQARVRPPIFGDYRTHDTTYRGQAFTITLSFLQKRTCLEINLVNC